MLEFIELNVQVKLKQKLHFQYAPEIIGKILKKAGNIESESYVFSNLGIADESGYFEKQGTFSLRSFDYVLMEDFYKALVDYEDKYIKVDFISASSKKYSPIKALYTLNPVFVLLEKNIFWSFKSSGDISLLVNKIQEDLLEKYELYFEENLDMDYSFVKKINFKNEKPFTYIKDGKKCFGYKLYIEPKEDEKSQMLSFLALSNGIGHLNEDLGGGFTKLLK